MSANMDQILEELERKRRERFWRRVQTIWDRIAIPILVSIIVTLLILYVLGLLPPIEFRVNRTVPQPAPSVPAPGRTPSSMSLVVPTIVAGLTSHNLASPTVTPTIPPTALPTATLIPQPTIIPTAIPTSTPAKTIRNGEYYTDFVNVAYGSFQKNISTSSSCSNCCRQISKGDVFITFVLDMKIGEYYPLIDHSNQWQVTDNNRSNYTLYGRYKSGICKGYFHYVPEEEEVQHYRLYIVGTMADLGKAQWLDVKMTGIQNIPDFTYRINTNNIPPASIELGMPR